MDVRWSEVTIDCGDPVAMAEFWQGLLGGEVGEPLPGWRRLRLPGRPALTLQPVPEPKTVKARLHLDLVVDDLEAATARVVALGGRFTGERHVYDEGTVVVMADVEGTEFCMVQYEPGFEET
ncbi:MAG: VOC family protein [Candidatus Nanopelagicales bacterium]